MKESIKKECCQVDISEADYFPIGGKIDLGHYRSDRIMYGSDFPNIPYEWDRELKILKTVDVSRDALEKISSKNAVDFFKLKSLPMTG